ncbi:unnamed protein product, partial [Staurois parvus]
RKNSKNAGRAPDKALGTKLNLVNVTFWHFQISCQFRPPYVPTLAGDGTQMTASTGGHYRGHCRRDIVGAQDKVREEGIPMQRCSVFPSVARGYRLW